MVKILHTMSDNPPSSVHPVKRLLLAWLAAFILGEVLFFVCMAAGIPDSLAPKVYATPAGDGAEAKRALLAQFPISGSYYIPTIRSDGGIKQWEREAKSGPVAMVRVEVNGPTPTAVFHRHHLLCVGAVTLLYRCAAPAFKMEAMVLRLEGPDRVRNLQRFMSDYRWDEPWMRQRHWEIAAESLNDEQGVWSIDASEFPK